MVKLINDTISKKDIKKLSNWLLDFPKLTKGDQTEKFEKKFSEWQECKYSVYVNSGSSANLLMLHALKEKGALKNNKILIPSVGWSTTLAPAIQLGFEVILMDIDIDTLCVSSSILEKEIKKHNPAIVFSVNILGFLPDYIFILDICKKHGVIVIEDSCETLGSTHNGIKAGNFGLMSSFSFYFSHIMSTIEGGMVCTDSFEMYEILKAIRSHGWDRDLGRASQIYLRHKYNISEFSALYTMYYSGFNVRATDLQAFIGLSQLKKLDSFIQRRQENFDMYQTWLYNPSWKIHPINNSFVCNFSYPIINRNKANIVKNLTNNKVECRPLVCGALHKQPFWYKDGKDIPTLENSEYVHNYGIYVPNYPFMKKKDIKKICDIVNRTISG